MLKGPFDILFKVCATNFCSLYKSNLTVMCLIKSLISYTIEHSICNTNICCFRDKHGLML